MNEKKFIFLKLIVFPFHFIWLTDFIKIKHKLIEKKHEKSTFLMLPTMTFSLHELLVLIAVIDIHQGVIFVAQAVAD